MLREIKVERKTKLYAKSQPQKTLCHYSFKCKSRADIVFSQKETGRQPNDLGLCEKHAIEMLEALQIMYGRNVGATEQIIIEASNALARADQSLDRYKRLVDAIFYSKDKKLSFAVMENLLQEDRIAWTGVPNTMKAVEMYISHQKPIEEMTMPTINEVIEQEAQKEIAPEEVKEEVNAKVSDELNDIDDEVEEEVETESELDKLIREAAQAEGVN